MLKTRGGESMDDDTRCNVCQVEVEAVLVEALLVFGDGMSTWIEDSVTRNITRDAANFMGL